VGQKVHPIGFRLVDNRSWQTKWYEEKNYAKWLHEDIKLREFVKEKLGQAGISKIEIERAASKIKINVHTARPGIVIGKRGAGIEGIKKDLQGLTDNEVFLNVVEVRKAETDAQLVAENNPTQLQRPIAIPPPKKKALQTANKLGANGIPVACSRPQVRRQGDPRRLRGPPRRVRDGALRVVPRGPGAPAHAARGHRLRLRRGQDDLRQDRLQGLDLPRRGSAG
jgi:ribosomal protein S3